MEINNDTLSIHFFVVEIFMITSPKVWKVWPGDDHLARFEWADVIADKARPCTLEYGKDLILWVEMPVGVEVAFLQMPNHKGMVGGYG